MVAVAYDMIRLFLGPMASTPRGIDRVDIAYLRYFAEEWPDDFGGTLPTAWGFRWFERDFILRWLDRLEGHWRESLDPKDDTVLQFIKCRLLDSRLQPSESLLFPRAKRIASVRRVIETSGISVGRHLIKSAPQGCIYVNIGQLGLSMEWLIGWLRKRPDIRPAFMLHDVIPILAPEFVSSRSRHYHGRMIDNAARFAAGMITTTCAAREKIQEEMGKRGRGVIPTATVPLPVASAFLKPVPIDRDLQNSNYLVICGTIEPRKNHCLLFDVWDGLVAAHGRAAPTLVMVGSRGWKAESILSRLERSPSIRRHIIYASGLSTPALHTLISHAKGLLMPSFAEGFGLPIIEALALGTPVIASGLAAHREVGKRWAVYKGTNDTQGWRREIERLVFAQEPREIRSHVAIDYRPFTSPEYFSQIAHFLGSIVN